MSAIERKVFERVLNMAQMHNIGLFHRGPNMVWTCRWNDSSVGFELLNDPKSTSPFLRLRYKVIKGTQETAQDYNIGIRSSLSYTNKTWYWYVCPLIVNGKPCNRRVRNLYFLPNSDYFGCKHCRDELVASLPFREQRIFHQTLFVGSEKQKEAATGETAPPPPAPGWSPKLERRLCKKCQCLSEGSYCCNCRAPLNDELDQNFLEILGVSPLASEDDIRVAFKTRLKEYHPDRVAHLGKRIREVAEEEIKQINLAYEVLIDPQKRSDYLKQKQSS